MARVVCPWLKYPFLQRNQKTPGKSMDQILKVLSFGWVGTTISLFALVVGVVLSTWGIVVSSKRPRPAVVRLNRRLLGGPKQMLPDNIQILFDGKEVPHIMRTLVWFWNAGNSTLRGEDIVTKDPLRLTYASSTKVLSVRVLKVTRPVLGFTASPADKPSRVSIGFDFLDGKDGALIEILHTGTGAPTFRGTIKGVNQIWMTPKRDRWKSFVREGSVTTTASVAMSFVASILTVGSRHAGSSWTLPTEIAAVTVAVILMLVGLVMRLLRRQYRVPKSLEEPSAEQRPTSDAEQLSGTAS